MGLTIVCPAVSTAAQQSPAAQQFFCLVGHFARFWCIDYVRMKFSGKNLTMGDILHTKSDIKSYDSDCSLSHFAVYCGLVMHASP